MKPLRGKQTVPHSNGIIYKVLGFRRPSSLHVLSRKHNTQKLDAFIEMHNPLFVLAMHQLITLLTIYPSTTCSPFNKPIILTSSPLRYITYVKSVCLCKLMGITFYQNEL